MIPRETGRGLSISGAHRVAAVERLVGATLAVALPRTAPPSAGHCLGTTGPGGSWSGDFLVADWDRRPERRLERRRPRRRLGPASGAASFRRRLGPASFRAPGHGDVEQRLSRGTMRPRRAPTRGAPTVIGNWSDRAARNRPSSGRLEVAPPGLRHDPTRNRAGIVHQRRPPRCRCRTTRRGDPCGRPPPERRHRPPAIAWALPDRGRWSGDFLVADWDRRLERRRPRRRLGPASFRAPGHGDVEQRLSRGTMRPRRAPTRGAPTVIGDWKFQPSNFRR